MSEKSRFRQTKYVIGLAIILTGVAIIVATAIPNSLQYYVTADELVAAKRDFGGKKLKVAGKVHEGSISKVENTMAIEFGVINEGKIVNVTYEGAIPDTFKEGAEVVVTGILQPDGRIEATEVLAKCASRYEEKLEPKLNSTAS